MLRRKSALIPSIRSAHASVPPRRPLLLPVLIGLAVACVLTENVSAAQLGGLLGRRVQVPVVEVEDVRKMQLEFQQELKQAETSETPRTTSTMPTPTFVLVDVRAPEESKVSVIPGAITAKQYESEPEKYRDRQIIAYCTSGYRSDKYAAKLIERGVEAVNMKASILGWCAAKLPLETLDRKPTKRVHTYSSRNKVPPMYEAVH